MSTTKMKITDDRTTNVQLKNFAKRYHLQIEVLMNDEFQVPLDGYYILNLENSGEGGSHWVALICTTKECFYFDSYGAPPIKRVHQLLRQRYPQIYMNNTIIQSLTSEMCGWFSVGLLLYVHFHPRMELLDACDKYLNMFDDNEKRNNKILKTYLNALQ